MTLIERNTTSASPDGDVDVRDMSSCARRRSVATARLTLGTALSGVGLASWLGWLSWRFTSLSVGVIDLAVLALELVAFSASLVVTAGLFIARPTSRRDRRAADAARPLPLLLAEALDLGDIVSETAVISAIGADDTGEIAWARRGIRVLGEQRRSNLDRPNLSRTLREATWSVVALDGLRRLFGVVVLIVILFSGAAPWEAPPGNTIAMLAASVVALSLGHWAMSGGFVRPGARLVWSMASIGAGLGDGISRSGFPIRWVMTMATLVALNISVALRGISDRWTHGLDPMPHDARVVSMCAALALVAVGGVALNRMQRPDLDFYGATRRLEERSVRRLALGLTLLVAAIGFVAGVVSADVVIATR